MSWQKCSAGLATHNQERTSWRCGAWGKPCLQWSEVVELKTLREGSRTISRVTTLDLRTADFILLQGSGWQDPVKDCPAGNRTEENWLICNIIILGMQGQVIQCVEGRAGLAEGQHGWTWRPCLSSNMHTASIEGRVKDWPPRRNIETMPECAEIELRKVQLRWSSNLWGGWREMRMAFLSTLAAKENVGPLLSGTGD